MRMRRSKRLSLESKGIRYKLRIAVYLMSVLPLLVCIYLVSNYILPHLGLKLDVVVSIVISIVMTAAGFFVIKEIVDSILAVSSQAKLIAAGDLGRKISVHQQDEVGDLSDALNQLTLRIRSSMEELKDYSQKTVQIDFDIQKRLLVLSTLLQINTLISQGSKLEEILKMTVDKSRLLANSEAAFVFLRKEAQDEFYPAAAEGLDVEPILQLQVGPSDSAFGQLAATGAVLQIDDKSSVSGQVRRDFFSRFALKNTLAVPVFLKGKVIGFLGIGNNRDTFSYAKDDREFLEILAKQMAIAFENDSLVHRVGKLEIKDALTGLYNEAFITTRLEEEIKRAIIYQRPCSFILLNIDDYQEIGKRLGHQHAEAILKKIAYLIRDSVTEIDRVARISSNEFAIVLPERNKRQALYLAEGIRKKIEFDFSQRQEGKVTVSGGVSENPLDGVKAEELFARAKALLNTAKSQGKDRILS